MALYVNGNNRIAFYDAIYFNSFGVEHIPKEIKQFIGNKKYNNKDLQNTRIQFDNVQILLYWIYGFYVKR